MPIPKPDGVRKRKPPKVKSTEKPEETREEIPSPGHGVQSKSACQRCISVTKYMLLFIAIPPFLNFAALNMESQQLHPPGMIYDVGHGQKLYFHCEGRGSPTIMLDAPTGYSSDVWSLVMTELAKHTKVCVYDRAGIGFSDRPSRQNQTMSEEEEPKPWNRWQEFTVERMADDLHRLLTYSSQQVEKPFIFVGSELGTIIARFYAQLYESDISDLVLIDPLVEGLFDQDDEVWESFWFKQLIPSAQAMQMSAAAGVTRFALMLGLVQPPMEGAILDVNVTSRQKHLICNPRHLSSVVDEHYFIKDTFSQMQTVLQLKAFPANISVTVITGNYYDEQLPSALNKAWAKSTQHLLSRLHPSSNHIVVNGADHHMLYREPTAVTEHIIKLIRKWNRKYNVDNR